MCHCEVIVRTDVSEIIYQPIMRMKRVSELGNILAVTSNCNLEATRRHIPEDGILHSHRRENLKSYIALTGLAL
jgi:hypothetical protein